MEDDGDAITDTSLFGLGSIDHIQQMEHIGNGSYGEVFKGVNQYTKETIALKYIKLEIYSEGVPSTTIREISALRGIEHDNVV